MIPVIHNDYIECPFCNVSFSLILNYTHSSNYLTFSQAVRAADQMPPFQSNLIELNERKSHKETLTINFNKCPSCNRISSYIIADGSDFNGEIIQINPRSIAKRLPDYIPASIIQDYEEACLIADLSPKASATLSRRVLQYMIRDFYNIKDKRTLHQEIEAIENKISASEYNAIMSLKSIGNIGAHPDKNEDINIIIDIDPHEAKVLLKLIEHFIESWYVKEHKEKELLNSIVNLESNLPKTTK